MSHTGTAIAPAPIAVERLAARRSGFYVGISGLLLLIVFLGFSRTFYLRAFFNVPEIPISLVVHGIALTAWFVGVFVQTALVSARRVDIHRRLGWTLSGIGTAVIAISLVVNLNFVGRQRSLGADIDAGIAVFSSVVWTGLVILVAFAVFLTAAVVFRRRPPVHKRLMLLASISILSPALVRIWTIAGIRGPERDVLSLCALVLLLLTLVAHDWISTKRVHLVTLVGATFFIGLRILGGFVIAASEFGRSFVRGL